METNWHISQASPSAHIAGESHPSTYHSRPLWHMATQCPAQLSGQWIDVGRSQVEFFWRHILANGKDSLRTLKVQKWLTYRDISEIRCNMLGSNFETCSGFDQTVDMTYDVIWCHIVYGSILNQYWDWPWLTNIWTPSLQKSYRLPEKWARSHQADCSSLIAPMTCWVSERSQMCHGYWHSFVTVRNDPFTHS